MTALPCEGFPFEMFTYKQTILNSLVSTLIVLLTSVLQLFLEDLSCKPRFEPQLKRSHCVQFEATNRFIALSYIFSVLAKLKFVFDLCVCESSSIT